MLRGKSSPLTDVSQNGLLKTTPKMLISHMELKLEETSLCMKSTAYPSKPDLRQKHEVTASNTANQTKSVLLVDVLRVRKTGSHLETSLGFCLVGAFCCCCLVVAVAAVCT